MYNLSFFQKYIGNYIIFLQYSKEKYNYKQKIILDKFIIYFNLINIIDLDSSYISNYFYFFRYFFGILPYYNNYEHKFHLNVHYYNFYLQYFFKNYNIYNFIYIFLNDIYFIINKNYILFYNNQNFFEFIIEDMNFFIERKNTLGFFSLIHSVKFKFILKNNLKINNLKLLNLLKLKT